MSIRVFVVDDHEIVRLGMRRLFEGTEIEVVGEASGGDYAMKMIDHAHPDLILLDVRLAQGDGFSLLAKFKVQWPNLPVLMMSAYDNPTYMHQAVALSAAGYLLKSAPRERLIESIRKAVKGENNWQRDELRRMTGALATPRMKGDVEVPLTQRESEVLTHLCEGLTNREIASRMGISYETVKEHVQHILHKIGVADRTQAAVWAVRHEIA